MMMMMNQSLLPAGLPAGQHACRYCVFLLSGPKMGFSTQCSDIGDIWQVTYIGAEMWEYNIAPKTV